MKVKHKEIYTRKSYSNNSFYAAFGQRKRKPMPTEQYVLNETKVMGMHGYTGQHFRGAEAPDN